MKPTVQLGLGQQLTMTPQLQQAIRLLQLSTLDLKQEIQQALESNLMLTTEEEFDLNQGADGQTELTSSVETDYDAEISADTEIIPTELPVDSKWDDQFDVPTPRQSASEHGDTDITARHSRSESLRDYLLWQMNLTPFNETDRVIAAAIIDGVDARGYLQTDPAELLTELGDGQIELEEVIAVLHRVQQFDPPGVAARDLQECIRLQLQQMPTAQPWREQALQLLQGGHFHLLANGDEAGIRRLLGTDGESTRAVVALIRSVNPHPGESIAPADTAYIEPDVIVVRKEDRWVVELNPDIAPRLRVNSDYARLIRRADDSSDNQTLKEHLQEARWFIKSLSSRNETLLRVASKIVEFQQNFFEYGAEAMKPLVLREIAEDLELHESTISRVTSNKYMLTPRGTLEFKYFFSSQIGTADGGAASATAIRALIRKLIDAEQPQKPLSDNKISTLLSQEGIKVARRTVAKYREAMAIPPSNERKRLI